MGSNEERSSFGINRAYDFSMSVHDDINTFMNVHEFAAIHDIDGQKVPAVITSRKSSPHNAEGVITRSCIMYVKDEYVNKAESGLNVRINGRLYVIVNAANIQGELWRIELEIADA